MSTDTTTGASGRPLTFFYLGRPAALCIDAMSQRRARPVTLGIDRCDLRRAAGCRCDRRRAGIGRLLALRLSDAGYAVALVARSQQELRETARLIEISGGRALCLAADVTDEEGAPEVIRRVEAELGPIELLVNNAGIPGTDRADVGSRPPSVVENGRYQPVRHPRLHPAGPGPDGSPPARPDHQHHQPRPARFAGRPSPPTPCPRPR